MYSEIDMFTDLLFEELSQLIESKRYIETNTSKHIIEDLASIGFWTNDIPQQNVDDKIVIAIDGGSGREELSGGGALYITRAIAVFSNGIKPVRELKVELTRYRSPGYLDLLRTYTEVSVARKSINFADDNTILLVDGSLFVILIKSLMRIIKPYIKRDRLSLGELKSFTLAVKLFIELYQLIRKSQENNVKLAFVSKNSSLRILKEYLLYLKLKELGENEIAKYLLNYPARGRGYIIRRYININREHKLRYILELLLNTTYRDLHLVDDVSQGNRGRTKPLIAGLVNDVVEGVLRRNSLKLIVREIAKYSNEADRSFLELYQDVLDEYLKKLPAISITYLKLNPLDYALMVETVDKDNKFIEVKRALRNLTPGEEVIMSRIAKDYKSPKYYNTWLIQAHQLAKLSARQMRQYIMIMDGILRKYGFSIPLSRRYSIGVG